MRFRIFLLLCLCILLPLVPAMGQSSAPVVILRVDAPIFPATANYVERGLKTAQEKEAQAIILRLNTPGGQIESMNRIVQAIVNSNIPVIVYVSPAGAMAGSAGAIITMAGHRSAMAPQTVIGAASPVGPAGDDLDSTMKNKLEQILVASAQTMTEERPVAAQQLAKDIILDARAVSAREALDVGLIDYIAANTEELLQQLDNTRIQVKGEEQVLHTAAAPRIHVSMNPVETLLQLLGNPNLVFLFMVMGIAGILGELLSPGGWVLGFIGTVSLALAAYGMGLLSVNWFGAFFLAIAFALFALDVKASTHGALTIAGVLTFIFGSLVLFNSSHAPEFQRVSVPLIITVGLAMGSMFAMLVGMGIYTTRKPPVMGKSTLIGQRGIVRVPLNPKGQVQVSGEQWSAEAAPNEVLPIERGEYIQVKAVEGLRLVVSRTKKN
ncbi:MAG: nodulation protein NfeD [Anaerolineae bacterium]|nr:MAG: nodulation protein NfeD [Anaerolineae bacterium]